MRMNEGAAGGCATCVCVDSPVIAAIKRAPLVIDLHTGYWDEEEEKEKDEGC